MKDEKKKERENFFGLSKEEVLEYLNSPAFKEPKERKEEVPTKRSKDDRTK